MAVRPPAAGSSEGKFVQLEGLPYGATEDDVRAFLGPDTRVTAVHIVHNDQGHAFVQLEDQRDLRAALFKSGARIDGKSGRYIKVWTIVSQKRIDEIKQRMSGAFQPPNAVGRFPVKVRGLPWEVKERDVLSFFRGLPVLEIVWGREAGVNGRFDGDAAVLFRTRNDQLAALRSHMKMFGERRYVEVYPFDPQSYDSYKFRMTTNLHYRPRTLAEVVDDPQAIVPTADPNDRQIEEAKEEDLIDWNTIPEPIPIRSPMQAPIQPPVGRSIENPIGSRWIEEPQRVATAPVEEAPPVDFAVIRSDSPEPTSSEQEEESNMPQLLHELIHGQRGFNEKMELVAEALHAAALPRAHTGGYAKFEELDVDVFRRVGVSGSVLAETMSFVSFEKMCLNSPQVAELFTWSRQKEEYCGRTSFRIFGFTPLVDQTDEPLALHEFQRMGLEERAEDPVRPFVDEHRQKGEFPSDAELSFRMRFCRTILSVQRGRDFVHYGLLQHVHEQLHGEPLKTESYRKYFPFKSQFTIDKVRERMIFELEKRTSPDGKGCVFRLRHPIDVVQRFHAELRKARQQHEEILARHAPIEDVEDSLDFGTMQPRGSRR